MSDDEYAEFSDLDGDDNPVVITSNNDPRLKNLPTDPRVKKTVLSTADAVPVAPSQILDPDQPSTSPGLTTTNPFTANGATSNSSTTGKPNPFHQTSGKKNKKKPRRGSGKNKGKKSPNKSPALLSDPTI